MILNDKQIQTLNSIKKASELINIDWKWAASIALVESSLGINQKSKTGCLGIFQMSSIAMKDLLQEMIKNDDELIDICCGMLFLRLLLKRWGTVENATSYYCDPSDRSFYTPKVLELMEKFNDEV